MHQLKSARTKLVRCAQVWLYLQHFWCVKWR